ncbi:hypothetical protein RHMOL_Rhmol02G0155000 [Rhododendron molle]|nr:hypothetical protein RHMOL_Rhmol02G0155000 [Rhododendron molle]
MVRYVERLEYSKKFKGRLCPSISKSVESKKVNARTLNMIYSEGTIFEVTSVDKTFVVDIEEHTCTCRRCDLSGIPCIHGCAAIISQKAQPEDYVNKAYTTDTFVRTYSHRIKPILDKSLWPQTECDPRMPPPLRMQFGGQRRLGEKERMSPIILSRLGSKYYYHVQTMWTIWVQCKDM